MFGGSALILLVGLAILIAVLIWALVDIMRSPWLQTTDRVIWVVIVVLLPLVGAAAWLIMRGMVTRREE